MKEVLRGASAALLIRILGTLLGFTVSVLIARLLGASGSGVYYLAISMATIAATIGRIGFDNTVVRFIASFVTDNDWSAVRFVYRFAVKVVSAASIMVAVIVFFCAPWLSNNIFGKPNLEVPLMLAAIAILPLSLCFIHAEALRGLKKITFSQLIKTVLISLATLLLLYPAIEFWGSNGAVVAFTLSAFITLVVARMMWRRAYIERISDIPNQQLEIDISSQLFQSNWPLYTVALTGLVMQQSATFFLGIWGSVEDIGIYNVANRVSSLILFPLMAMISILAPKFAVIHRQGDIQTLAKLARKTSLMLTIFAIPVALIVAISAEWILSIFGPEFKDGVLILCILLIGIVVNAATGAVSEILMMAGFGKDCRNVNLMGAFIIIILSWIFIPPLGGIGASIAVSTGISLKNIFMVIMVKVKLGFWSVGK